MSKIDIQYNSVFNSLYFYLKKKFAPVLLLLLKDKGTREKNCEIHIDNFPTPSFQTAYFPYLRILRRKEEGTEAVNSLKVLDSKG